MPIPRAASRSTSRAHAQLLAAVIDPLVDDHRRIEQAYHAFRKMPAGSGVQAHAALVDQVLRDLTLHAALEEGLLYPAARGAMADEGLIDDVEVEHESVQALVDQLRVMEPQDAEYVARFIVLCDYVVQHLRQEERELFPQLVLAPLDWARLAPAMSARRVELLNLGVG